MTALRDLRVPFACFVFAFLLALPDARREAYAASAAPAERREAYAPQSAPTSPKPAPVFSRDIAPLVFEACTPCHRPGGPGPFSLASYRRGAAARHPDRAGDAQPLHAAVEGRARHRPLRGTAAADRRRAVDARGVGGGRHARGQCRPRRPRCRVPRWLAARHARPRSSRRRSRSRCRPSRTTRSASSRFRCRCRSAPIVRGIEFHPGNPRVVHHANIRVDRTAASRAAGRRRIPLPGYDGLMPRSAEYPDGHFLGWTPGQVAPLVAPDLAWTLEPGSDLVVQLHMQPSGAVEEVRPVIGLYFSRRRRSARPASCGSARRASTSRPATAATSFAMPTRCRSMRTCWRSSRTRTTGRRRSSARPRSPTARRAA